MYNNRYITELSISEVKEYYEILRENRKLTHEEIADYGICKERLIAYAYENIDVLDKIRAEIEKLDGKYIIGDYGIYGENSPKYVCLWEVLQIIDKYKESEE